MKKFLALLLAVVMVLSLAACGSEAPAPAPTEAPAEQPAETPAEQPAEEPTAEPVEEYTGPDTFSMIANFDITTLDYVYNNKSSNSDYTCNFVEGLLTQDNHGKLVPGMAAIYIVCALVVVIANAGTIPGVFASIFQGAFNPSAVVGGAVGVTMKLAITKGVGRGVFSNEAGLGSAPIAHAATSEKNPVRQGLYGIFEVFMDTIVICTLTSLVVLCSGAATGNYGNNDLAGVPTAVAGFASVFGDKLGSLILAVGLLLFATSTILGWALYGTRCAEFLFGSKIIRPYQVLFCLVVVAGSVANLKLVWDISDTLNGLMAIPNLIGILLLSPVVIKLTKEHFNGVKAGKLE